MSMLSIAARRSAPLMARGSRQVRHMHTPHYDAFAVDTVSLLCSYASIMSDVFLQSNKRQAFVYYGTIVAALATPVFAIKYQL